MFVEARNPGKGLTTWAELDGASCKYLGADCLKHERRLTGNIEGAHYLHWRIPNTDT